jgi:hypothetical protein
MRWIICYDNARGFYAYGVQNPEAISLRYATRFETKEEAEERAAKANRATEDGKVPVGYRIGFTPWIHIGSNPFRPEESVQTSLGFAVRIDKRGKS